MKTLLEKAIVHLLNGDEDKAAALFHKFMVERARQIHESLRQNDGLDESLDQNWDSEIKEEEYFDDDDLGSEDAAGEPAPVDDTTMAGDESSELGDEAGTDDLGATDDAESGFDDAPDEFGDEAEAEPDMEGKIDELTDKIDELTAEFDRVMAEFHDEGAGDMGDEAVDDMADDTAADAPFSDDDTSGFDDTSENNDDLADRMEDDMADEPEAEHEPMAEGELPDFLKKNGDKEEVDEGDDDDLTEITESVLAELDRIAPPGNTEHKGVGVSSVRNTITSDGKGSPLPHHNVMDRIKGEPVMTKGPTHKGYARETPPPVAPAEKLVQNVRPANRRKSFKDTMGQVAANGDGAALLNKDFAGGVKPTKSIVDGKTATNK